jgi:hypothetical protein
MNRKVRKSLEINVGTLWFMESLDLQNWTRIGAMNRKVRKSLEINVGTLWFMESFDDLKLARCRSVFKRRGAGRAVGGIAFIAGVCHRPGSTVRLIVTHVILTCVLLLAAAQPASAAEIFSTNSVWRFRKGGSEASSPSAAWRPTVSIERLIHLKDEEAGWKGRVLNMTGHFCAHRRASLHDGTQSSERK